MANIWTPKAGNIHEPWNAFAGYTRGKIIHVSSYGPNDGAGKVSIYDAAADSWAAYPDKRDSNINEPGTSAVIENRLHVIKGNLHKSIDVETQTWQTHEPLPLARQRSGMQGGAINGKIYLAGGWGSYNYTDVYNPATNSWAQAADMPEPMHSTKCTVLDNKLHVISGFSYIGGPHVSTHYVYNPVTDSWTTAAPLGGEVSACGAGGGWMWAVSAVNKSFHIYKSSTDAWTPKLPLPASSGNAKDAVLVYGNKLVHWIGGSEWEHWRYEPDVTLAPEYGEFTGETGAALYPAPEALPHVITMQDTKGDVNLARKLQENFEAIERQLLALEPEE